MNDNILDVVVVGGGIAGLAATYELQRLGVGVHLLEAASRLGGAILTERFDGWVIDGGPDSLLVQKPAAVVLCRELGLADRLVSTIEPRIAYVLREGQLHAIPEGSFLGFPIRVGALAKSSLVSWGGKLRMALEVAVPRRENADDESIGAFVRRRFGGEAVDYLAEPLLAGIHAGDVETLSLRALFPRLLQAETDTGSVIRALRALKMQPAAGGAFVSLPGGIGELVDAIAAILRPGTAVVSARVTQLHRAGTYVLDSAAGRFEARAVILAVPAYAAAGLLRGLDTTLAGLCDAVPYASTATVAFGYRRDQVGHPMQGSGFVVPRVERSPLLAATWVTSKWPGRAPPDCALMRGFLGGGRDPSRLDRGDDELIDAAREELETILDIHGPPLFSRLYRWPRQSPQYQVGHLDRVAAIDQRVASIPGVFLTGSGFRATGIPDCIADGRQIGAAAAQYVTRA